MWLLAYQWGQHAHIVMTVMSTNITTTTTQPIQLVTLSTESYNVQSTVIMTITTTNSTTTPNLHQHCHYHQKTNVKNSCTTGCHVSGNSVPQCGRCRCHVPYRRRQTDRRTDRRTQHYSISATILSTVSQKYE